MLIVFCSYLCVDIVDVLSCSARPELAALIPMHPSPRNNHAHVCQCIGVYVSLILVLKVTLSLPIRQCILNRNRQEWIS